MTPEILVIDVDGVLTDGSCTYTVDGKTAKVFGPDDNDALKLLARFIEPRFVSADERGFVISKRRVSHDMGFALDLVQAADRVRWISGQCDAANVIYMGGGIFDAAVFEAVGYGICPADGFSATREAADFVTTCPGGRRAVAEACVHILDEWFGGVPRPLVPADVPEGAGA